MFAKLKKKIENEGGVVASNAESPRRSGSVSSLVGVGVPGHPQHGKDGPSPPASVTSEDPTMRDLSSARDDMAAMLQKKSEQCRKMEGNISDLAALIKDKSKTIEKLEASLKLQDEVLAKKLQDQKEEFESYRDKLIQGYQADKLKLDQLLNTEQELTKCRSELESKTRLCQTAETQVEKLTDEIGPVKQKLSTFESDNHRLKEENMERAELITKLSKEKAAFDKRLDEMNKELTEKQSHCNSIQAKLADVDETHKTHIRNSDLQRNKNEKHLREKDDLIDSLKERVATLEQRLADSNLSGDDQATALEAERKQMELKLDESRQQLTEIKSTWSDKITHLEEQISHLNTKIAEDGEEISNHQRATEQMRDSFEKQIEELKNHVEDAEKRALENFELAASKESLYEKQLMTMESKSKQEMELARGAETRSRTEADGLQKELVSLKALLASKEDEARETITQLEKKRDQLEAQTEASEFRLKEIQTRLGNKEEEASSLVKKMQEKESAVMGQDSTISSLQNQVKDLETSVEKAQREKNEFEKHLRISENDKGDLLEKNADLYRQMEVLKKSESECRQEHQRTLTLKAEGDTNVQKTETMLRQKIQALETQIEQSELSKAESGLYSSRIEEMGDTISTLENQLADKNRMVKKQEQMLKDLRVTLQRELKVQALPGDDNFGDPHSNGGSYSNSNSSPSVNRKVVDNPYKPDLPSSSHSSLQPSGSLPMFSSSSHRTPQQQLQHQQYPHANNSSSNSHPQTSSKGGGHPLSPAVLSVDPSSPMFHNLTSSSSSVPSGAGLDNLTAHTNTVKRELEKDVNFQYLKHVVLKFMLSREAEALQLIKAVSMLLNFSNHEQQLMRETLEWKMSWFGARPPQGRGQTSKVIPPTFY